MAVSLKKPELLNSFVSGDESIQLYNDYTAHCFFSGEYEKVDFNKEFFDFVKLFVDCYPNLNVVDEWYEITSCFELFEAMDNNQQVLFDYVIRDYSYSYDLHTLCNYCLENACLFEGSASDYAYDLINDCYDTKNMGSLVNYIDYDAFACDMLLNSEIVELSYNLFWTNPNNIY